MSIPALPSGRALRAALFLHGAALFAFAYGLAPLYYSNQKYHPLNDLETSCKPL